jgi:hypothetical protein
VHNYFGNGILDFLGSICAIYLVILISKWLDGHTKFIRKLLLFYGKNSLWVLGFHVFELNLFPWWHINVLCDSSGINSSGQLVVLFVLKVLFATAGVIVLKRLTAFWKRKNSVAC